MRVMQLTAEQKLEILLSILSVHAKEDRMGFEPASLILDTFNVVQRHFEALSCVDLVEDIINRHKDEI